MEAARLNLQIVVHESEQIALLERAPAGHRFVVWLKINTGMNRLGFRPRGFAAAFARLAALQDNVAARVRLMTHFALAEEPEQPLTAAQIATLCTCSTAGRTTSAVWPIPRRSSRLPGTHAEWVRPGIALYGVSPFADRSGRGPGAHAGHALVSTVIAVRDVPAGETVGYGGAGARRAIRAWQSLRPAMPTACSARTDFGTPVLVRGRRATLAGRVSMDMVALDVTGIPACRPGDEAVLFGPELPVEEVAGHAGTIGYELLCAVSQRVPRVMV